MSSPEIPDFSLGLGGRRAGPTEHGRRTRRGSRAPAMVEALATPVEAPETAFSRARLACLLGELAHPSDGAWWVGVQPVVAVNSGPPLCPDLAAWTRFEPPGVRAPDWVGDVLQPRTAAELRVHRRARYRLLGVGHSWLLDPVGRVLEAYRSGPQGVELIGAWTDGDVAEIEPFTDLRVEVSALLPPR